MAEIGPGLWVCRRVSGCDHRVESQWARMERLADAMGPTPEHATMAECAETIYQIYAKRLGCFLCVLQEHDMCVAKTREEEECGCECRR